MSFEKYFRAYCNELGIEPNAAQVYLSQIFEQKSVQLREYCQVPSVLQRSLSFILGKTEPPKGLYIYGPVGRGKTMMMDVFTRYCTGLPIMRAHFHEFMQDVHSRIAHEREIDAKQDALSRVALNIAKNTRILCFDEFEVTNIADAMIMGRLFTKLFQEGVVLIATSNIEPENLYADGLSRALFVPFLEILKAHVKSFHLTTDQDYRTLNSSHIGNYYIPLCAEHSEILKKLLKVQLKNYNLDIAGRGFPMLANAAQKTAYITFHEACAQMRGAPDYKAIANTFTYIALDGIPQFAAHQRNEAQRLKTLIDILYEHKTTVYFAADCPPEALFIHQQHPESFARTVSRIIEMRNPTH